MCNSEQRTDFDRISYIIKIQACKRKPKKWMKVLYYCSKDECCAICLVNDRGVLQSKSGRNMTVELKNERSCIVTLK